MLVTLESLINDNINANDEVIDMESLEFDITDTIMECSELSMDINTCESALTVCDNIQMEGFGEKYKGLMNKLRKFIINLCSKIIELLTKIIKSLNTKINLIDSTTNHEPKNIDTKYELSLFGIMRLLFDNKININELKSNFDNLEVFSGKYLENIYAIHRVLIREKINLIKIYRERDINGRLTDEGLSHIADIKREIHDYDNDGRENVSDIKTIINNIKDVTECDNDDNKTVTVIYDELNKYYSNIVKFRNDFISINTAESLKKIMQDIVKNYEKEVREDFDDVMYVDDGLTKVVHSSISQVCKTSNDILNASSIINKILVTIDSQIANITKLVKSTN